MYGVVQAVQSDRAGREKNHRDWQLFRYGK